MLNIIINCICPAYLKDLYYFQDNISDKELTELYKFKCCMK